MKKTTSPLFIIIAFIVVIITSAGLFLYHAVFGIQQTSLNTSNYPLNLQTIITPNNNQDPLPREVINSYHVLLYYPNQKQNPTIDVCSKDTLLPVSRVITNNNPIPETIKLLINGELTDEEHNLGFQTEFPHEGFKLIKSTIQDSTLILTLTEIPGFTNGGACRTGLLAAQIEKTALQFPEIKHVVIQPVTLFQP